MRVFIAINGLGCGGAEKSLISFLSEIPAWYVDEHKLKIDLLVLNKKENFFKNIPSWVNVLSTNPYIDGIFETLKDHLKNPVNLVVLSKKLYVKLNMKLNDLAHASRVQKIWNCWKSVIPCQPEKYDLAISYVDGFSNYYVVDKVRSDKKILWVHNEYEKLAYDSEYDRNYFQHADAIVTISDLCVESLLRVFPEIENKIWMIPNISSQSNIWNMAKATIQEEIKEDNLLVSIGRLNEQKGFDIAIEAASILAVNREFIWLILGEGELRDELEQKISHHGLDNKVFLLGNRSNPYPYINRADLFIQPSRYEGKSIVLDEAKILEKPIVVTNYTTVKDSIVDGVNGSVAEIDAHDLANKIDKLLSDKNLQEQYRKNLHKERLSSNKEIDNYLSLLDKVYMKAGNKY